MWQDVAHSQELDVWGQQPSQQILVTSRGACREICDTARIFCWANDGCQWPLYSGTGHGGVPMLGNFRCQAPSLLHLRDTALALR